MLRVAVLGEGGGGGGLHQPAQPQTPKPPEQPRGEPNGFTQCPKRGQRPVANLWLPVLGGKR